MKGSGNKSESAPEASSPSQEELELALINNLKDILDNHQDETEHERANRCRQVIEAFNKPPKKPPGGRSGDDKKTGGGSNSDSHSSEVNMELKDFFRAVVRAAKSTWPNNDFYVQLFFDMKAKSGRKIDNTPDSRDSKKSIRKWLEEEEKQGNLYGEFNVMVVNKLGNNNPGDASSAPVKLTKLTQTEIDINFGDKKIRLLWNFLKTRLLPLDKAHGIIEVNQNYVNCENAPHLNSSWQTDKARTIVIAGESGSGKSVLSCLISQKYNYLPFYMLLDTDLPDEKATKTNIDNDGYEENEDNTEMKKRKKAEIGKQVLREKGNQKKDQSHADRREILENVIALLYSTNNTDYLDYMSTLTQKFNVARNEWAKKVLNHCVEKFVSDDDTAKALFDGNWASDEPDKVAIILDEATDIDLVEGLIEVWRDVQSDYSHLAQTHVQLILTGTGLDAIDRRGRVGTDPGKSHLIKLKEPKLDELPISRQMKEAINAGVYSRVLKTNARMLFRGIIPTMRSRFFSTDAMYESETRNLRLLERLKGVGSTRVIMDYSVRFYVSQNSVGQMNSNKREKLLKDAFLYHLISSVENMIANNDNDSSILNHSRHKLGIWNEWRKSLGVVEDEIFKRGLAAEYATSPALRYLASFGLTCEARCSFGGEFEHLVVLHVTRLMEVEGYDVVKQIKLRYGWPHQSSAQDIGPTEIERLETSLQEVMNDEVRIVWPTSERFCIIFSQGGPSAQGPDIFVLVKDGELYYLDAIQCKHHACYSKEQFTKGWWSLGYSMNSDDAWEFGESENKAGYSYVGIKAFAKYISSQLGAGTVVKIRNMILATSLKARSDAVFPSPVTSDETTSFPQIWFREMLQPTISIFEPSK